MYIPNVIAKYPCVFLAEGLQMEEHNAPEKEQKYFDISVWVGIRKSHALWRDTSPPSRAQPENGRR